MDVIDTDGRKLDRELLASLAIESLIKEVETTPKPGLVDRRNNGSHSDMDIHAFKKAQTH